MSEKKLMSVKLLVDKSSHKVLFAEAGKGFVDLLFSLLGLPLGSAIRLLTDKSSIDVSISKLCHSVDNLSDAYIRSGLTKTSLLDLVTPSLSTTTTSSSQTPPLLLQRSSSSDAKTAAKTKRYYTCSTGSNHGQVAHITFPSGQYRGYMSTDPIRGYVSDVKGSACPRCSEAMAYEIGYVAPPSADGKGVGSMKEEGFVKGGTAIYMVTDDLEVMPMSTISSITLLTKFNVRDVGALEEKVVEVRGGAGISSPGGPDLQEDMLGPGGGGGRGHPRPIHSSAPGGSRHGRGSVAAQSIPSIENGTH